MGFPDGGIEGFRCFCGFGPRGPKADEGIQDTLAKTQAARTMRSPIPFRNFSLVYAMR